MQLEIIKAIQMIKTPLLDSLFQFVTMLGEETIYLIICSIIAWCINKRLGYKLGFIMLSSGIVNDGLKALFRIPRPIGQPGIISIRVETAPGYAFPSGHTQLATSFWTPLMYSIKKGWIYLLGGCIIAAVAFSRVYLGLHWPMDALCGVGFGILWVWIADKVFQKSVEAGKKTPLFLILVPALLGAFIIQEETYYKIAGALLGFVFGYCMEDKCIGFDVKAPLTSQIAKCGFGLSIAIALKSGLKLLLPELIIADFFRYMILCLWVTVGAPFIFTRFKASPKDKDLVNSVGGVR